MAFLFNPPTIDGFFAQHTHSLQRSTRQKEFARIEFNEKCFHFLTNGKNLCVEHSNLSHEKKEKKS